MTHYAVVVDATGTVKRDGAGRLDGTQPEPDR